LLVPQSLSLKFFPWLNQLFVYVLINLKKDWTYSQFYLIYFRLKLIT